MVKYTLPSGNCGAIKDETLVHLVQIHFYAFHSVSISCQFINLVYVVPNGLVLVPTDSFEQQDNGLKIYSSSTAAKHQLT